MKFTHKETIRDEDFGEREKNEDYRDSTYFLRYVTL
jgi:hypothetical protein